jgi:hypothetical protein
MKIIKEKLIQLLKKKRVLTTKSSLPRIPSLYLNENVTVHLKPFLASYNIAAVTTKEAGNKGFQDEQQLEYASKKGYILVTHNRRCFKKIYDRWMKQARMHHGIITIGQKVSGEHMARRIYFFFMKRYNEIEHPFCETPPS